MTISELYISIKEKFKELNNGKGNIKLYASNYFIPSEKEFAKRLSQAMIEYNLDDIEKIQKVLFAHTAFCSKNNFPKFTKTIKYFIYGQNGENSRLADDYDNIDEDLVEQTQTKFKSNIK